MPPSSQESDAVADAKIEVNVSYGDNEVTVRVRSGKTFASLFNGACDHFEVDKDTSVFLHLFRCVSSLTHESQITASNSSNWWSSMEESR